MGVGKTIVDQPFSRRYTIQSAQAYVEPANQKNILLPLNIWLLHSIVHFPPTKKNLKVRNV